VLGTLTARDDTGLHLGHHAPLIVPPVQTGHRVAQVARMAEGAMALGWLVRRQLRAGGRGRAEAGKLSTHDAGTATAEVVQRRVERRPI
jgi:hypothetical protein